MYLDKKTGKLCYSRKEVDRMKQEDAFSRLMNKRILAEMDGKKFDWDKEVLVYDEDPIDNDNTGGKIGESKVDYELKWLGSDFVSIPKDCADPYGNETILLENQDFIDEEQEYDHIVISKRCVYIIETKNYKGKLTIAKNGNWIRTDENGRERGERSPVSQIDRHHKLLLSILGNQVRQSDVIDILCIAHDSAIIVGYENSPIPIVKVDMLNRFIQRFENKKKDKYDPEVIADLINDFKVSYED